MALPTYQHIYSRQLADKQQVPWNDHGLNTALDTGAKGAAASPWVAALVNAGIGTSSSIYPSPLVWDHFSDSMIS